jgi:hypothetical protein
MQEILDDFFYGRELFDHFLMMALALEAVFGCEIFGYFLELVVGFSEICFFHSFDFSFKKPHIQNIFLFRPFCVMEWMIADFLGFSFELGEFI